MEPAWNEHYPDPRRLKAEVGHMLDAFVEALLANIAAHSIKSIYAKGSALKDWQTPLDYVPELSDVDIHLLLADDADSDKYLGTTAQAMRIAAAVEAGFYARVPAPLHVPRPQLTLLNQLQLLEGYVPSPPETVRVLHGEDCGSDADYSDANTIRLSDCRRMLNEEAFLAGLPMQTVDRPAQYIWLALRAISWHVSPTVPRALHMLGVSTEQAWSVTRSQAVRLLKDLGEDRLATDYADFYLQGWDFVLSRHEDSAAGRRCLLAGADVIARGIAVARAYAARHSA
jgi:hypothetical protein